MLAWLLATALCAGCAGFVNPVWSGNHADPFVLRVDDGSFTAYATNTGGENVPMLLSRDLRHWQRAGDALPRLPSWAREGRTWAPEVIAVGGRHLLYFTARHRRLELQCIGVARGERAQGPFEPIGDEPLVCQTDEAGSIDPSPFRAPDGSLYLYWKSDGNARGMPTWLYGQRLADDGLGLVGEPQRLLRNDAAWEGAVIEAPTVVHERGSYLLLYSANDYATARYAVGYAVAESPLGPYRKASDNPLLATSAHAVGPGHQAWLRDDAGQPWLLYHAWRAGAVGGRADARRLHLDRLRFRGAAGDAEPCCVLQIETVRPTGDAWLGPMFWR